MPAFRRVHCDLNMPELVENAIAKKEYSLVAYRPETCRETVARFQRGQFKEHPVVVTTASGSCSKEELIGRGFAECLIQAVSPYGADEVSDKCAIKGKSDEKAGFYLPLLSYGNESVVDVPG